MDEVILSEAHGSRPRRILIGFLLAATAVLGVVAGWLAFAEPGGIRTKDGSRLYVAGITWGKSHPMVAGSWWQQTLMNAWPAAAFGGARANVTTPEDHLIVWVRRRGGADLQSGMYLDHGPPRIFEVLDEHGCSFHRDFPGEFLDLPRFSFNPQLRRPPWHGPNGLLSATLASFPRRSASFNLALVPAEDWRPDTAAPALARFHIPVPPEAQNSQGLGAAEPYPIRRRVGGSEFVISGIATGIPWWATPSNTLLTSNFTPPTPTRWREPELRFHTLEAGRRSQEWLPLQIAVSDGGGNRRTTDLYPGGNTPGRVLFDGLCRFEPTWKCELELIRRAGTEAAPDRQWKVRIPIPGKGKARELRHQYRKGGLRLNLATAGGGGRVTLPDGTEVDNRHPTVQVESEADSQASLVGLTVYPEGRGPGIRAGVSLDGQAPELAFIVRPELSGTTGVFQFPVPAGTRWVDAEFGIYATRKITFLAQPPR